MAACVICGAEYSIEDGRFIPVRLATCSPSCHEELVHRIEAACGKFKKVVRLSTGEAFKVPTRDIIEKGIKEQELDQYPKWDDSV